MFLYQFFLAHVGEYSAYKYSPAIAKVQLFRQNYNTGKLLTSEPADPVGVADDNAVRDSTGVRGPGG